MVHRPTSYIVGEPPSFFETIGIILAVLFGCIISVCVALGFMTCCVMICCPSTVPNTNITNVNPNRERRFFTNLNAIPRRDFDHSTHPAAAPMPTAPPLNSTFTVSDTENTTDNMDLPPSYAEVTLAMEKKL